MSPYCLPVRSRSPSVLATRSMAGLSRKLPDASVVRDEPVDQLPQLGVLRARLIEKRAAERPALARARRGRRLQPAARVGASWPALRGNPDGRRLGGL